MPELPFAAVLAPQTLALFASAAVMGAGGSLHCIAMCSTLQHLACGGHAPDVTGAPGGHVPGGRLAAHGWALQAGRIAGYTTLGAIAGVSGQTLLQAARWQPALQTVWIVLQAALLVYGLALLVTGRQLVAPSRALPGFARRRATAAPAEVRVAMPAASSAATSSAAVPSAAAASATASPASAPSAAASSATASSAATADPSWRDCVVRGFAWALMPCGLLYSALGVALMAATPLASALTMTCFGVTTALGLGAWSAVVRRLLAARRWRRQPVRAAGDRADDGIGEAGRQWPVRITRDWDALALRLSGALIAVLAAWALWALARGEPHPFCIA